jgi:DNA gyrase subunit B
LLGWVVANAVSSRFIAEVRREGHLWRQEHARGKPLAPLECVEPASTTGTSITFWPDPEIFTSGSDFSFTILRERLSDLAYLMPGICLRLRDERTSPALESTFCTRDGLAGMLEQRSRGLVAVHPTIVQGKATSRQGTLEIALAWFRSEKERWCTFANTEVTAQGGTHLSGLREGVTRAVRLVLRSRQGGGEGGSLPNGEDMRHGLFSAVAVQLEEPMFSGATRDRLHNPEVQAPVAALTRRTVETFLRDHPDEAEAIFAHILDPCSVDPKTGMP